MVTLRGMEINSRALSRVEPSFQSTDNLVQCIIGSLLGLGLEIVKLYRRNCVCPESCLCRGLKTKKESKVKSVKDLKTKSSRFTKFLRRQTNSINDTRYTDYRIRQDFKTW